MQSMQSMQSMAEKANKLALGLLAFIFLVLILGACGDSNQNNTVISLASPAVTTASATTPTDVTATPANATTRAATTPTAGTTAATTSAGTTRAATTPTAGTTAATTPGAATTSAISAVPTVGVNESVKQEIERIGRQAEKTRGLSFTNKVESNFMTRDDLAKYQEADFRKSNPPNELARYTKVLEIFGFVPKNFDLARVYIDLLNEQVLGFYDPETKKLYMVVESDPNKLTPLVKFTAEHELTHGLQDQAFDLKKFRPTPPPGTTEWNDDKDFALTALIEGDATQSQLLWLQSGNLSSSEVQDLLKEINTTNSNQLDKAPLLLKDTLTFPYDAGANFVQQLYKKGGWAAVDKAFRDYPPKSTSQILHFDKYENKVEPATVKLPDVLQLLGSDWKTLSINTQGELQTRIWLEASLPNAKAVSAAKGWAGDRYHVVENGKSEVGYIWRSQWDSDSDASEFSQSASANLVKIHGLGSAATNGGTYTWSNSTHDISLTLKDREVLIVVLPKGTGLDKLVKATGF